MAAEEIMYTKNTKEVRDFLDKQGFKPLSFFQGKEYIYVIISTWANIKSTWKEKEYSTFNENEKETMRFLNNKPSDVEVFKTQIQSL